MPHRLLLFFLVPPLTAAACGCGRNDAGDGRRHVSGKVTFNGAPVPAGRISFTPDAEKHPDGAQGAADIKGGAYDTRTGRGTSGGRVLVQIEGYDGNAAPDQPLGKALFLHEETIDLPPGTATRDFVVPPGAAKNVGKPDPV